MMLLLDLTQRPGRTGHRLRVGDAKAFRGRIRHLMGTSREDTPTTREILAAASLLSKLLNDATEGDARRLLVELADGEAVHPAALLQTLEAGE